MHIGAIIESPTLKDGSGRKLQHLHDLANHHLHTLKALGYEPSRPFVTYTLELKLDQSTKLAWQKYSNDNAKVPHYMELIEYLDMRAQASEKIMRGMDRKPCAQDISDSRSI